MSSGALAFLSGLVTMGYLTAGLFFVRFWRRTRDRLFAAFAAAFGLLALEQALLTLQGASREEQTWVYLLRIAAYGLIIAAVIQKNRARP
jgi:hypothetical protein